MALVPRQLDLIIFNNVLLNNRVANVLDLALIPGFIVEVGLRNETSVAWNVACCFRGSNVQLVSLNFELS